MKSSWDSIWTSDSVTRWDHSRAEVRTVAVTGNGSRHALVFESRAARLKDCRLSSDDTVDVDSKS